jgi:hypothetical protein
MPINSVGESVHFVLMMDPITDFLDILRSLQQGDMVDRSFLVPQPTPVQEMEMQWF